MSSFRLDVSWRPHRLCACRPPAIKDYLSLSDHPSPSIVQPQRKTKTSTPARSGSRDHNRTRIPRPDDRGIKTCSVGSGRAGSELSSQHSRPGAVFTPRPPCWRRSTQRGNAYIVPTLIKPTTRYISRRLHRILTTPEAEPIHSQSGA